MSAKNQGGFLKELAGKWVEPEKKAFSWEKPIAEPAVDEAAPKTADLASQKEMEQAPPTEDIPRTVSGHIDMTEIKQDLISQIKSQRKR